MFSTYENDVKNITYNPSIGLSDHLTIHCTLNVDTQAIEEEPRTYYNYDKANFDLMRRILNKDWETILEQKSTQEAMDILDKAYNEAVRMGVPKRTVRTDKRSKPPWMTDEALKLTNKKNSAFIAYLYTKHPVAKRKYYSARNTANHAVKRSRKYFEKKLAEEVRRNTKGVWKFIKSQRASKSGIPDMRKPDGTLTTSDQEAAEVISSQYYNILIGKSFAG